MTKHLEPSAFRNNPFLSKVTDGNAWTMRQRTMAMTAQLSELSNMGDFTSRAAGRHFSSISATHGQRLRRTFNELTGLVGEVTKDTNSFSSVMKDFQAYAVDRTQRAILTTDILRERGDNFFEHEAAGCPPVLIYDYDVVMQGHDLPRPCNYSLLKIRAPEGIVTDDTKRPYVIIDPRAGHGAGIGGFKSDSQVGVALKNGHPVYFVSFSRMPEQGQTLADVTRAEAAFVRYVQKQHPEAPKPVVIGNCQGGWATLILGAANPDLTGPLVLNGAPVETWSGDVGANPMRYNAGVLGGQIQPMFWADIGDGVFDGAWLVLNFEMLNPGRTWFRKYYDLFEKADTERGRFLEFERWWSGFFLLNEPEIVWIVRELFVGNKLARNEARLEHGRALDVKQIRSPIIVFASHGDNITPVKQAINWIMDTYADETEIRIRGQRIVYMVHDNIGHLGIFVSSSIAKREHAEVSSTLETIEALAPGLYEMKIDEIHGEGDNAHFTVSFAERKMSDLPGYSDGREDEVPFAAVQHVSELQAEMYDVFLRPFVQASVTRASAEIGRMMHPLRLQRALLSSRNPVVAPLESIAKSVTQDRKPAAKDNPFVLAEKLMADAFEQTVDIIRDVRDACYEMTFYSIYATPYMHWFGRNYSFDRTRKSKEELLGLPEVRSALMHVKSGGFAEAVIRMLIMLAGARETVRRDRLERSAQVLTQDEPFSALTSEHLAQIVHEQTLIVEYAHEEALAALPEMLKTEEERLKAVEVAQYVPGALDEMEPRTLAMIQRFREVLGLEPVTSDITRDPLRAMEVVEVAAE